MNRRLKIFSLRSSCDETAGAGIRDENKHIPSPSPSSLSFSVLEVIPPPPSSVPEIGAA
jgi:hypothetical protein